jgi:hypothetical protein
MSFGGRRADRAGNQLQCGTFESNRFMERTIFIAALGAAVAVTSCGERRAPASRTVSNAPVVPTTVFADAAPRDFPVGPTAITDRCALDSVNRLQPKATTAVPAGSAVSMSGWMADDDATIADRSLVVQLVRSERSFYALTTKRAPRHDVNATLGLASETPTGFELDAKLDAIPAGEYEIRLLAAARGRAVECATKRRLRIG